MPPLWAVRRQCSTQYVSLSPPSRLKQKIHPAPRPPPHCLQGSPQLSLSRQLVGNVDEVTDVRFVGGSREAPSHVAVATNCEVREGDSRWGEEQNQLS